MKKTIISVMGKDTVGITANVAEICKAKNVNILDISQSIMQEIFVMVMMTDTENITCSMSDFRNEMTALGEKTGLAIHVMHEDVFNSMHRI